MKIVDELAWRAVVYVSKSTGRRYYGAFLRITAEDEEIDTTPIASVSGRVVTTRSGSRYLLNGDLSRLARTPFYLTTGEAYPMGSKVQEPPPVSTASLAEATEYYKGTKYILVYPEGDWETFDLTRLNGAQFMKKGNGGKIYLNGIEVDDD